MLEERVQARRRIFDYYQETLSHLPGIDFGSPLGAEAYWGRHTRWLTCITVNPQEFGATRKARPVGTRPWARLALEAENIEARPRPVAGAHWAREAYAFAASLCGV